jgi:8-amino-7-oxononanoate synthase
VPPLPSLEPELTRLLAAHRIRALSALGGASRSHPTRDGHPLLGFASNDYLGLASHPLVLEAAQDAGARFGFGAGAARLVTGHLLPHRDLEQALAELVGLPAALLFPTGYQTNLGVLTCLAGPDDLIASDQLNHASIIDGCRLSKARIAIYRHRDASAASEALATPGSFRRRFLVTESLFSMDGDQAPLVDLARAAQQADATFMVDEAHALGVLGPSGRGLCRAAGVVPDILVGTLGKAFGSLGGFAAGAPALRDYLLNRSRPFIYTTGTPAPVAAAAHRAVSLALSPEGDQRRHRLQDAIRALKAGLSAVLLSPPGPSPDPNPNPGPIVPVIVGSERAVLALSRQLAQADLLVPAIRPPTVPEGTARLRITLSADHTAEDVARLVAVLVPALTAPPTPL